MKCDEIELFKHDCILLPSEYGSTWQAIEAPFIVIPLDCFSTDDKDKEFRSRLSGLLSEYFNPNLFRL